MLCKDKAMRNFLYNKSDILVAAVIVIVAIIIIWSRIDAIMSSEDAEAKTPAKTTTEAKGGEDTDDNTVQPPDNSAEQTPTTDTPQQTEPSQTATQTPAVGDTVKFKVKSGMASGEIANALKEAGLIASIEEFNAAMSAKNAEKKLRAGTYNIPVGSTPDQIVTILLK
jgi:hypothetical protein